MSTRSLLAAIPKPRFIGLPVAMTSGSSMFSSTMARTLRRGDPLPAAVHRCLTQSLLGNGERRVAEYLLGRGADLNWIGHDGYSPLDAANRSAASEVVQWLRSQGAKSAKESTVG